MSESVCCLQSAWLYFTFHSFIDMLDTANQIYHWWTQKKAEKTCPPSACSTQTPPLVWTRLFLMVDTNIHLLLWKSNFRRLYQILQTFFRDFISKNSSSVDKSHSPLPAYPLSAALQLLLHHKCKLHNITDAQIKPVLGVSEKKK